MAFFRIDKTFHGMYPHEIPTIGSIAPNNILWDNILSGPVVVDVYGTGYVDTITAWLLSDPIQITPVTFISDTHLQLTFTSSNCSAGVHNVYLYNRPPKGGNSTQTIFTVTPTPHISNISPSYRLSGNGAQTFTITGTGFIQTSVIKANNNNISTTYVNPTTLTFSSLHVTTVGLYSINVFNTGATISNTYSFHTWDSSQTPHLSSINPISVNCGLFDYAQIHIYGTGFIPISQGTYGSSPLPTTFVSDTEIIMTLYISDGEWGTYQVGANNPSPGIGASDNTKSFTIATIYPIPTITSIAAYPGNELLRIVNGTGFEPAMSQSVPVTYFLNHDTGNMIYYIGADDYVSSTQFYWNISGFSYGVYNIGARNNCGGTWSGSYSYNLQPGPNPAPTITNIDPSQLSCPLDPSGGVLDVNGSNFVYNATVEIYITVNGQKYNLNINSVYYNNINQLIVYFTYPVHYFLSGGNYYPVQYGNYTVKVTNPPNQSGGGGNDTHTFTFTPTYSMPSVSGITPSPCTNKFLQININGSNFSSNSVVAFKENTGTVDPNNSSYFGYKMPTTYVSANQLILPNGTLTDFIGYLPAGDYVVGVYTPCGGMSTWTSYTVL